MSDMGQAFFKVLMEHNFDHLKNALSRNTSTNGSLTKVTKAQFKAF